MIANLYPSLDVGYPTITIKVEMWNNYCTVGIDDIIITLLNNINTLYASPSNC